MGFRNGGPVSGVTFGSGGNKAAEDDERFTTSYRASFVKGKTPKRAGNMVTFSKQKPQMLEPLSPGGPTPLSASLGGSRSSLQLAAAAPEPAPKKDPSKSYPASRSKPDPMSGTPFNTPGGDVSTLHALSRQLAAGTQATMKNSLSLDGKRHIMELLASPDLGSLAMKLFKDFNTDPSTGLTMENTLTTLNFIHRELGLPPPRVNIAEQLFKKFDVNDDRFMQFNEFYELFLAQLRRIVFDRTSVASRLNRGFFVTQVKGKKVWDVFRKQKELGSGTFGTAYLATRKTTGEERVVKSVLKSKVRVPLDDVEHEILVMQQVDHPHVLRLFEWYEDAGSIYLVLEPLRGGTLKDVLFLLQKQQKGLQENWIRKVMEPCIEGMAYCHSLRLIHKDLKDENIMLLQKDDKFDDPFPVIIDLGIAEMFSTKSDRGNIMGGTPLTMAPEVWKDNFGPKADVWSLGCVLYELLAGKYPFMAMSMQPNAWLSLHKKGPDWGKVRTSKESRDLCRKMLAYDEAQRPTMRKCTELPFFALHEEEMAVVPQEQFNKLLSFNGEQDVKRALLLEIASRLPMGRSGEIVSMFEGMDADGSGSLNGDEVQQLFARMGITDPEVAERTFLMLDSDADGSLSFTEFASGMLLVFKDLLEARLYKLFQRFDLDGSGCLEPKEAKAFLEDVMAAMDRGNVGKTENILNKLLQAGGDDDKGKITYQKIRAYMLEPQGVSTPASTNRSHLSTGRMSLR